MGNKLADMLAGMAAKESAPCDATVQAHQGLLKAAWSIRQRHLCILTSFSGDNAEPSEQDLGAEVAMHNAPKLPKPLVTIGSKLRYLQQVKGHKLAKKGLRWVCTQCLGKAGPKGLTGWCNLPQCAAIVEEELRTEPIEERPSEEVQIAPALEQEEEDPFGYGAMGLDDDGNGQQEDMFIDLGEDPHHEDVPSEAEELPFVEEPIAQRGPVVLERLYRDRPPIVSLTHLEQVHVGGKPLHPTHSPHYLRGYVFCMTCGFYCTERALRLLIPCTGPAEVTKGAGLDYKRRLQDQEPPKSKLTWPNGAVDVPDLFRFGRIIG